LEPENEKVLSSSVIDSETVRDVEPDTDSQSFLHVELPPWAESYEISVTEIEGQWSTQVHKACMLIALQKTDNWQKMSLRTSTAEFAMNSSLAT
jgi:hypothetical protein